MKKILLSFIVMLMAAFTLSAQLDCNDNLSASLDVNGEGEILISDLVSNIEFMLTQGNVTYFVSPQTYGTVTSSADVISLTCENRGTPSFIVEVEDNGDLLSNCSGTMVITSPNAGCPGTAPAFCDEEGATCSSFIDSYSFQSTTETVFYAIDLALCEDALGCDGTYSIALGTLDEFPTLDFGVSVSSEDMDFYQNPVVLMYDDVDTNIVAQANIYLWDNAECILTADYNLGFEIVDVDYSPVLVYDFINNFFGDCDFDDLSLSLTQVDALDPSTFVDTLVLDCEDLGQRRMWVRNDITGFTVSRIVTITDPSELCGTVLGPGDRLIGFANDGPAGFFFNHEAILNPSAGEDSRILPRHPSGIGWIINEDDLLTGENTIFFDSESFGLNGVSTLDLVLGIRLIILDEYNDPYEAVLLDIDQSGYDGISDLIGLREIILGITDGSQFPEAYFFNNNYSFPSDFNPFDFENNFTEYTFDKANYNTEDFSFEVFKVGDLNESAVPGFQEKSVIEVRSGDLDLVVPDMYVEADEEITFTLKYKSDEKFKGLLTALIGDELRFDNLTFDAVQTEFNIINENELRILYADPNSNAVLDEISFTISAKAFKAGELVDLLGLKSGFPHEVVNGSNEVILIDDIDTEEILSVNLTGADVRVEVYPNPATQSISISSKDSELESVVIFNAIGQKVHTQSVSKINNTVNIDNLSNGIYFMTISTVTGTQRVSFIKE